MLTKRKKLVPASKTTTNSLFQTRGLFTSKQSKENLLEEFRKGTLFSFQSRREQQNNIENNREGMEEYNWLSRIRVDNEQSKHITYDIQSSQMPRSALSKQLPSISLKPKKQFKRQIERKCNKKICFQKKLKTTGAWNKQNKNGLDPSIDRLARAMGKNRKKLVENDFIRVAGLSLGDDSTLQKSVNADLSMSSMNPFAHLSIFSITDSDFHKGRPSKLWLKIKRRKYFESEGDSVPAFLLNYLSVDHLPKKKKKNKF